jgi:predicted ATPase
MTGKAKQGGVQMFKSMRLKNFKAHKDTEIPLKPLTILIGANNSGKSSILHAILVLKQTIEDRSGKAALVTSGPLVELNGFYDILHCKNLEDCGPFGISLSLTSPSRSPIPSRTDEWEAQADRLDLEFSFSEKTNEIQLALASIYDGEKKPYEVRNGGNVFETELIPATVRRRVKVYMQNFLPQLYFEFDEKLSKALIEKAQAIFRLQHVSFQWTKVFHRIHRVGPLRQRVPWYSGLGTRTSSELGSGGENLLAALGNTEKVEKTDQTLEQLVNSWVADTSKLGLLKKLHLEKLDRAGTVRMLLGDEIGGTKDVNVAAMGEGISQVLPIIARLLRSSPGECLLIEQPELHLHPRLQAALGDLFIETTTKGKRQVIVETHSEHLLLRIRRRVAEGALKPEQVAILFVEKDGPECKVRELQMNGKGHLADWPKGFFDEAYQEAMAIASTSFTKKKGDSAREQAQEGN